MPTLHRVIENMKGYKYIVTVFSFLVLISCQNKANHTIHKKNNVHDSLNLSSLEGYWIMSDYIDSILHNKAIEKQTNKKLTSTAIILHVVKDSFTYHGLILGNETLKLNNSSDSLAVTDGMGEYQFSCDDKNDLIKAKCIKDNLLMPDSLEYSFRRVRKHEQRLIEGIDNKLFFERLQPNFYSYFIDSLISGEYELIKNDSKIMKLENTGTVSGFKNYNKYKIHDYFGTLHPFRPEDVIVFEDTTIVHNGNGPPGNIDIYSWEFKKDTLILTEMLTETYESYYNGTVKYEFIKSL